MTVGELVDVLQTGMSKGRIFVDDPVLVRDLSVPDEEMEAGGQGYAELEEVLVFAGGPRLLIGGE